MVVHVHDTLATRGTVVDVRWHQRVAAVALLLHKPIDDGVSPNAQAEVLLGLHLLTDEEVKGGLILIHSSNLLLVDIFNFNRAGLLRIFLFYLLFDNFAFAAI